MHFVRVCMCMCVRMKVSPSVRWRRAGVSIYRSRVSTYLPTFLSLSTRMEWGMGGLKSPWTTPVDPRYANALFNSLLHLAIDRRKLNQTMVVGAQNAPASDFSTSIAQSSGRTGRRISCVYSTRTRNKLRFSLSSSRERSRHHTVVKSYDNFPDELLRESS